MRNKEKHFYWLCVCVCVCVRACVRACVRVYGCVRACLCTSQVCSLNYSTDPWFPRWEGRRSLTGAPDYLANVYQICWRMKGGGVLLSPLDLPMNWIRLEIKWISSRIYLAVSLCSQYHKTWKTLVPHRWAAHHCVGGSNPDAYERSLASYAVNMLILCTPLFVEKASVAPDVTFGITAHKQERVQVRVLDLKAMRKDTQNPKQEQSVAPQNVPWSNTNLKK